MSKSIHDLTIEERDELSKGLEVLTQRFRKEKKIPKRKKEKVPLFCGSNAEEIARLLLTVIDGGKNESDNCSSPKDLGISETKFSKEKNTTLEMKTSFTEVNKKTPTAETTDNEGETVFFSELATDSQGIFVSSETSSKKDEGTRNEITELKSNSSRREQRIRSTSGSKKRTSTIGTTDNAVETAFFSELATDSQGIFVSSETSSKKDEGTRNEVMEPTSSSSWREQRIRSTSCSNKKTSTIGTTDNAVETAFYSELATESQGILASSGGSSKKDEGTRNEVMEPTSNSYRREQHISSTSGSNKKTPTTGTTNNEWETACFSELATDGQGTLVSSEGSSKTDESTTNKAMEITSKSSRTEQSIRTTLVSNKKITSITNSTVTTMNPDKLTDFSSISNFLEIRNIQKKRSMFNLKLRRSMSKMYKNKSPDIYQIYYSTKKNIRKNSVSKRSTVKSIVESSSSEEVKKNEDGLKEYIHGVLEYDKSRYVPKIIKKDVESKSNEEQTIVGSRSNTLQSDRPQSPSLPLEEIEKVECPAKLKIDRISMFSENEMSMSASTPVKDQHSSCSSTKSEDPAEMLIDLKNELLLPSDESNLDLQEFYEQFPLLNKSGKFKPKKQPSTATVSIGRTSFMPRGSRKSIGKN